MSGASQASWWMLVSSFRWPSIVLADHLLHLFAFVAVRTRAPLQAKCAVDTVGRLLPALSLGNAMRVGQELEGRGTCLTRALTVASRLPGSDVVLGTDEGRTRGFAAHAWVEYRGTLVCGTPAARYEIARLTTGG